MASQKCSNRSLAGGLDAAVPQRALDMTVTRGIGARSLATITSPLRVPGCVRPGLRVATGAQPHGLFLLSNSTWGAER